VAIYDGIEDVQARDPFLTLGKYRLAFVTASEGTTYEDKVPYFRATVKVVSSEGPEALPPGARAAIFIKRRKFDMHLRDIKALAAAITGEPMERINGPTVKGLMTDDSPASGIEFLAEHYVGGEDGKTFRAWKFFPVPEETASAKK